MQGRTAREAIAAQFFADLDGLTSRVASLPGQIDAAAAQLAATARALDDGADRYRQALTAFNAEARDELEALVRRQSDAASRQVADTQRATLHEIVRAAFRSEASDKATALATTLEKTAKELALFQRSHLLQTALTCIASSLLTTAVCLFLR